MPRLVFELYALQHPSHENLESHGGNYGTEDDTNYPGFSPFMCFLIWTWRLLAYGYLLWHIVHSWAPIGSGTGEVESADDGGLWAKCVASWAVSWDFWKEKFGSMILIIVWIPEWKSAGRSDKSTDALQYESSHGIEDFPDWQTISDSIDRHMDARQYGFGRAPRRYGEYENYGEAMRGLTYQKTAGIGESFITVITDVLPFVVLVHLFHVKF